MAENFFTYTMADLTFNKVTEPESTDENPFIEDLFENRLAEVGHIQLVPKQNRIRITATVNNEENRVYDISNPRLEFLRFIFQNTNPKVKRALRAYFLNSKDAQKQNAENRV